MATSSTSTTATNNGNNYTGKENSNDNNDSNNNGILISKDEKRKQVIELYFNQRKTMHIVAKETRMSLRDITPIIKEYKNQLELEQQQRQQQQNNTNITNGCYNIDNGNGDGSGGNGKLDQQQQNYQNQNQQGLHSITQLSEREIRVKAFQLYGQGKTPLEVSIALYLSDEEAIGYYKQYWSLKRHYQLCKIYPEIELYLPSFLRLYKVLKKHNLHRSNKDIEYFVNMLEIGIFKLPDLDEDYTNLKEQIISIVILKAGMNKRHS